MPNEVETNAPSNETSVPFAYRCALRNRLSVRLNRSFVRDAFACEGRRFLHLSAGIVPRRTDGTGRGAAMAATEQEMMESAAHPDD